MTLIVSVSDLNLTSWFCGLSVTSLYKSFSATKLGSFEHSCNVCKRRRCTLDQAGSTNAICVPLNVNSLLGVLGKSCLSNSSWLSVFLLLASLTQESNSLWSTE